MWCEWRGTIVPCGEGRGTIGPMWCEGRGTIGPPCGGKQRLVLLITAVGTREVKVDSVEEALLLLKLGLKNRHVAGTKLNYQSSRSHSIFTIKCIRTVNDNPSHAMVNRSVC